MLKIGITGGIGSGKSTVCRIFSLLGVPVFDADLEAKKIMETDPEVIGRILKLFGPESYSNGKPVPAVIAGKAFADSVLLRDLNSIVHPAVFSAFNRWASQSKGPYVLKEAALMYESGSDKNNDFNIMVSAPQALRLSRASERDGSRPDAIQARMNAQMPEEEKIKRADFIIYNDETHFLIPQVLALHERFSK